ncbi:hypothetical protein FB451DRAFT_403101 [Mycena latifolia]|nr:hypothetical protein FB451DRAFT_403101 [Mycena latifolia]
MAHSLGQNTTAARNIEDPLNVNYQGDRLGTPTRICGCACEKSCNCRCTCAFRAHCVCISPCDKKCGNRLSRNLVVSIDGTSNHFGVHSTNVVELHSRVLSDDQCRYYNAGIGTYVSHQSRASWLYWREQLENGLDVAFASLVQMPLAFLILRVMQFPRNFKGTILNAYQWLCQTHMPGDKIFLFGFSRGAYQVRALAAMIEKVGLVHAGNKEMIPFTYEIYSEQWKSKLAPREADLFAEQFKKTFSRDIRVHFAGLWDTVSSVGLFGKPLPLTWSARQICIFRHALALDERRVKFLPEYVASGGSTLPASVEDPSGSSSAEELNPTSSTGLWDVKEVWFPGTHSDIGGGLKVNLELNISSVPLLWMENEATSAGLRLKPRATGGPWRLIENLPFKRLTYKDSKEVTITPHLGVGRTIIPGQRVHVSVAFMSKDYLPRAKFLKANRMDWKSFVGQDLAGSFNWAHHVDEIEMDLFDASFMIQAIENLRALWAKDRNADGESEKELYWSNRLKFMALSGQLAANYLGVIERRSPGTYSKEIDGILELFQSLRTDYPRFFDLDVAILLEKKADLLLQAGEAEMALEVYREAEPIRRRIATEEKSRDIENLAKCLENICTCCNMLGLVDEAKASIEEAVKLRHEFTTGGDDPKQIIWLGHTLSTLATALSAMGRHEEALITNEKTVNHRRKLVKLAQLAKLTLVVLGKIAKTDDLTHSLHNLGIEVDTPGSNDFQLRAPNLAKLAVNATELAVRAPNLAKLADMDPIVTKDLADLGVDLTGPVGGTAHLAQLAELAKMDPSATKDLAQSLHNLAAELSMLGRHNDALHADVEAVVFRRQSHMAPTDPQAQEDLAQSLDDLGIDLLTVGRHEDATHAHEESIELRRRLARTDEDTFKALARSFNNLGINLRALGRHRDAVNSDEQAVEFRRKLAGADPKALAQSLHNLGVDFRAIGRREDSLRVSEEAVGLLERLAETDRTVIKDLARSLFDLGKDMFALGRHDEAVRAHEGSVQLRRELAETDSGATFTKGLASSLRNLAVALRAVNRPEEAALAEEEVAALRNVASPVPID